MIDTCEIKKLKEKSRNFAVILVLEFAYCFLFYVLYATLALKSVLSFWFYGFVLLVLPLVLNVYLYLKNKKNIDSIQANNIIIIQILLFLFAFRFLI